MFRFCSIVAPVFQTFIRSNQCMKRNMRTYHLTLCRNCTFSESADTDSFRNCRSHISATKKSRVDVIINVTNNGPYSFSYSLIFKGRNFSTKVRTQPWPISQRVGGLGAYQGCPFLLQARFNSSAASVDDEIYGEVATKIKASASNILVMVGAGISTPSGIPDFRTPGTGLYDNLQKYNLPYPEAIFDIHYFMMDPRPFIALAQDLYPGVNYKPNIVHYLLRLIYENRNLQKLYTQNIDGLERMAGIPGEKLMEAHGTFAAASCTLCGKKHPAEHVKNAVIQGNVPKCEANRCKGKVKPDIVFFGENLPEDFWNYHTEVHFTDLLLVIGTSLEVYPFAGIADAVGRQTPRVLINRESVGSFGTRTNDYMLLGDLETTVKRLVKAIGWEEKLNDITQNSEKL